MSDDKIAVSIEQLQDYQFQVTFNENLPELIMDEPPPVGSGKGPNASKLVAAAVGSCLTASLLFCLRKWKADANTLHTTVSMESYRNENNRLRLGSGHVTITIDSDKDAEEQLQKCLPKFEDFCVVTQSVRDGIDFSLAVRDEDGKALYDTRKES